MIRLCLETAARCLGIALMDGEIVRAEFLEERTHSQSALLFPAVEDLLRTSGIALEDVTEIDVAECLRQTEHQHECRTEKSVMPLCHGCLHGGEHGGEGRDATPDYPTRFLRGPESTA